MPEKQRKIKKILFVITQSELGGAQRFLELLCGSLSKSEFDITVALGKPGATDYLEKSLISLGIKILRLKKLKRDPSLFDDIGAVKELRRILNVQKPDTLFLLSSKAGFIGSLAARISFQWPAIRVIYRIGGWTFNDPWPQWKRKLWIFLERFSARWKHIIIVNSEHDYHQAQQLKILPRQTLVNIPNGFDAFKYAQEPRHTAREKLYQSAGLSLPQTEQFLVGTVANFYPAKGLELIVELARRFKDSSEIQFVVVGTGRLKPMIEKMIMDQEISTMILTGSVENSARYMSAFDIFLIPSWKEGFPNVLLEAMAAKLPIIASSVGGIPDAIEHGVNGFLFRPGDVSEMERLVRYLHENDRIRMEIGIQAHQTLLFKYPLDKMVREISALL